MGQSESPRHATSHTRIPSKVYRETCKPSLRRKTPLKQQKCSKMFLLQQTGPLPPVTGNFSFFKICFWKIMHNQLLNAAEGIAAPAFIHPQRESTPGQIPQKCLFNCKKHAEGDASGRSTLANCPRTASACKPAGHSMSFPRFNKLLECTPCTV